MTVVIERAVQFEVLTCCNCGVSFGIPRRLVTERRRNHETFYCPNGHSQYFPGESDVERLERELKATKKHAREMYEWGEEQYDLRRKTERQLSATKAAHTRTKKRIVHGVCPCCNRTFQNLTRHMAGQHPEYETEA